MTRCTHSDCKNRARIKVSGDAGWSGVYCFKHTMRVIKAMLPQVWKGHYAIYVQRYYSDAELSRMRRNYERGL